MNKIISKSKNLITKPQNSILSAATLLMFMIIIARAFGFIRLRILAHYYIDEDLSLFFAAFRLPDLVFEVFTLGALSSAFIPVFTKSIKKHEKDSAFSVASTIVNFGLIATLLIALIFGIFAPSIYKLIAPGFTDDQVVRIAQLARILFLAQAMFVVSYVLTGVLESLRRFFVPALAPIFYNVGIILGIIFFHDQFGLLAAAIGVILGALLHLSIQLPLAYKLGFRFSTNLKATPEVKKIRDLAAPRMIELAFLQVSKITELFFASTIAVASYAHYNFAYTAQAFPVGLFGVSLAKAALPTLSALDDEPEKFKKTFLSTLYQIQFLVIPLAMTLAILRIPIVRLLFGTDLFDWPATVQTGVVLSTFAIGVPFQAANALLTKAFYALNDTKTPVKISIAGTTLMILSSIILIKHLNLDTWGLALAYSLGTATQALLLFLVLGRKLNNGRLLNIMPILKSILASSVAGSVMYFIIKFFDRAVWVKRLSFFLNIDTVRSLNFEKFVIDTRYAGNLLALTLVTITIGAVVYLFVSFLLKSSELNTIIRLIKNRKLAGVPQKETEIVAPKPEDTREA